MLCLKKKLRLYLLILPAAAALGAASLYLMSDAFIVCWWPPAFLRRGINNYLFSKILIACSATVMKNPKRLCG